MPKNTITLLAFILFFLGITILSKASVTISNVSPSDGQMHVDIQSNPPDPGGYVTLSWQLNDTTGGGDMEFWMDIWNGTAWVTRIHLTDQSNGTWSQDEAFFNTTNTTYQWRIRAKDWTDGTWTNQTFSFTTDRKPNPPTDPEPANNSYIEAGNITLKVRVSHPDYDYGARIYNVSFHEYPSGRLIGYNYSATGFANNTIVTCNVTWHCPYKGTTYYWYAVAHDDEYEAPSPIFKFTTYYNDTEPDTTYLAFGTAIYVQPPYIDTEPDTVYLAFGTNVPIMCKPVFTYYQPPNGATDVHLDGTVRVDVQKYGEPANYTFIFYGNATNNGTFVELGRKTACLLYTSPSPRDISGSRMPSSA